MGWRGVFFFRRERLSPRPNSIKTLLGASSSKIVQRGACSAGPCCIQGGFLLLKRPNGREASDNGLLASENVLDCLFSPYCDTMTGLLYYEAFDGGSDKTPLNLNGSGDKESLWGFQGTIVTPEASRKERVIGANSVMARGSVGTTCWSFTAISKSLNRGSSFLTSRPAGSRQVVRSGFLGRGSVLVIEMLFGKPSSREACASRRQVGNVLIAGTDSRRGR